MDIKDKYAKSVVTYDNMQMYFISTAKELVKECKRLNIGISLLEAFKLTGDGIQPSQEHSISFADKTTCWEEALRFLNNVVDNTYLYEIWYEGY